MTETVIRAEPIRIIPFDLGRELKTDDLVKIDAQIHEHYHEMEITKRQRSILKNVARYFQVAPNCTCCLYRNGIAVIVVQDKKMDFADDVKSFAIRYCENRKQAHSGFFLWSHPMSPLIWDAVMCLRQIVRENSGKNDTLRRSADEKFENKGLSYVMTLSLFDLGIPAADFGMPKWLMQNISALLDPSILYLEDSSSFHSSDEVGFDLCKILEETETSELPTDYEKRRHISVYMSWASVVVLGQIQENDREEYITLETQLQSDWFFTYCLEKSLDEETSPLSQRQLIDHQWKNYEIDLLENRLYDFDDSSVPARVLKIQKGLVETSGLDGNIQHLRRKIQYVLDRERLKTEMHQKRIGRSTELLLFLLAFIEIAPTVAEYGNSLYPELGVIANGILVLLGLALLSRKS